MPSVVITDCNFDPDAPHPVFVEMQRLLAADGITLIVDNVWSDAFVDADLIIGADPLFDSETLLNARVLGQRTLNRFTRLQQAAVAGGPLPGFCSPADDAALSAGTRGWGEVAVLKYDWSLRRNGVFLWPLGRDRRPFPDDFKPGCDLFMEFLPGDPQTYKVDTFGGALLGGWILPTRHMQEPDWQVILDANTYDFDPPAALTEALGQVGRQLLAFGAGYVSFDLMRAGDGFKIIEINTCGVGTSIWKTRPERYARNYAAGIRTVLGNLDAVPKYAALRAMARQEDNDNYAVPLKQRPPAGEGSGRAASSAQAGKSFEQVFFADLLQSERLSPRRLARSWQDTALALLKHARATVPYYRDRLSAVLRPDGTADWDRWNALPLLSDADVAGHREQLLSRNLPAYFGAVGHLRVVGASGQPFTVTRSVLQVATDSTIQARLYAWFEIDPAAAMATLLPPEETASRAATWCPSWLSAAGGPEHHGDATVPVEDQLRWLGGLGEVYLRTTAVSAHALALAVERTPQLRPRLKGILVHGEIAGDDLRQRCARHLACGLIDSYRRVETGSVVLRCPREDRYHVQSEVCLVEIVDAGGRPCAPGATGEIVVTPLYAYAMPLIRYRTGDVAVQGPPFSLSTSCACGRSLPAIARFVRCNGVEL